MALKVAKQKYQWTRKTKTKIENFIGLVDSDLDDHLNLGMLLPTTRTVTTGIGTLLMLPGIPTVTLTCHDGIQDFHLSWLSSMVFQTDRGPFKNRKQNASSSRRFDFFKVVFYCQKNFGGVARLRPRTFVAFCWKLFDKFLFGGVTVFFPVGHQVRHESCKKFLWSGGSVCWLIGWLNRWVYDLNLHIFVEITWSKSWIRGIILLMDKILHHQGWWISPYLRGFNHLRWCRILSINSIMLVTKPNHPWSPRDSVAAPMVSVVLGAGQGTWNVRQVGRSGSGLGFLPRLP